MKKFAKMSLVAAVAVAGLTTTSSAQALEEAIKNVDVSGTVVYRYDDTNYDDNTKDSDNNKYKIGLNLKSQVNDDVTAVTRFIVGSSTDAGFVGLNHSNGGDGQADVTLSNVYFSYTGIANTTVNVGKQGLTTPWTVAIDADGNEQTGTGILALTNVGPVTIAGAYFNQTNLGDSGLATGLLKDTFDYDNAADKKLADGAASAIGSKNVATLGVMGNIGPVALDAWYLDMDNMFDTYTLGAAAKFDLDAVKLSMGIRHTEVDLDSDTLLTAVGIDKNDDHSLTKVDLGAKMGIFGAKVAYGWTDSEGGVAALDADAKTGLNGWQLDLNGVNDASLLKLNVNAQVMPTLNLALNYNILDRDGDSDERANKTDKELYLQASYQMSKNFGGYIRFGQAEFEDADAGKDNDGTIGRLQVQYSF